MFPNITETNQKSLSITHLGNPKYLEIKQHATKWFVDQRRNTKKNGKYFN